MGLLSKAIAKAASEGTKTKKASGTDWIIPKYDPTDKSETAEEARAMAGHVMTIIEEDRKKSECEARAKIARAALKRYGNSRFCEQFVAKGRKPESPMKIVAPDGQSVGWVLQDKTGSTKVGDDNIDALNEILGNDVVERMTFDEVDIGFNRDVMAVPGVSDVVEAALEGAVEKLVTTGVLSADQADSLLSVSCARHFRPGIIEGILELTGRDVSRLEQTLDAMGGAVVRYPKL